jgi:DNA-directed RNA polymerase subunit RPC12/RpoP
MAELKPCPKCGFPILAHGMPIKVTTPKMLRPVMRRLGYLCVRCGHWELTKRAWNRRAEDVDDK